MPTTSQSQKWIIKTLWQRTTIALVATASSKDAAEREVRRAIRFLESNPEWEMSESHARLLLIRNRGDHPCQCVLTVSQNR